MNAQCTESEVGIATCVCHPGFTGDGLNCSGQLLCIPIIQCNILLLSHDHKILIIIIVIATFLQCHRYQ